MLLILAGLHGSGKSHLSSMIEVEFGWERHVKRDLLRVMCQEEGVTADWESWYRRLYLSEGPEEVTRRIFHRFSFGSRCVIDSAHNFDEWRTIRALRPDAVLALVIAPRETRLNRIGGKDPALDVQRIRLWHGEGDSCLAAECSWCFNGAATSKLQAAEFREFLFEHSDF